MIHAPPANRSRGLARSPAWQASQRSGFTLVEIIIVALLLGVLLSGVWSMFQMQNRMMMQGQRISRENTEIRGLWNCFRADIQTLQLPSSPVAPPPRRPAGSIGLDNESTLAAPLNSSVEFGSQREEVTPVRFMLEGGQDWLVFDRQRPWQQWPGLPPSGSGDSTSIGFSGPSTTGLGSLNSMSTLPSNVPTPYQRVMYIWLTAEEIQQYLGTSVQAPPNDQTATDLTAAEGDSPAERWLFRLSRDWGQSYETESSVSDDPVIPPEPLDVLSTGGTGEEDTKLEWLEWFAAASPSPYLQFEQWQGNISETDTLATDREEDTNQDETNVPVFIVAQTQIDWLTTVTAGQFRYRVNGYWRSRLSSLSQIQQLQAIEVQYNVDPHHVPTPTDDEQAAATLVDPTAGSLADLPGFDELEDPVDTTSNALDSTVSIPRPEFDYVCLAAVPRRPGNGSDVRIIRVGGPAVDPSASDPDQSEFPSGGGGLQP